ncbi:hypothetical protein [Pseudoalteromonas piscicida]|uniref:Uncharacterized protein n=1 Tax=Pseudoalteromonas piscicida TaxID=43662 RepID=A0A2A5JLL2_PSEO7|nr:hypothetical protein [Pseudoalteromonas piscicida]PCK30320.1 hypothetical protein CEX98_18635 [Pseudoalteromonas piscicida]
MGKLSLTKVLLFTLSLGVQGSTLAKQQNLQESDVTSEIKQMFELDQKMINEGLTDSQGSARRRERVLELVASNRIDSAEGFFYACIILQHTPKATGSDNYYASTSYENHLLAFYLCKQAYELNFEVAGWYAGAAMDRYLLSQGKSQRYGTHWRLNKKGDMYIHDPVDPHFSDAERAKLGIEPLVEIQATVQEENKKLKSAEAN